MIAIRNFQRYGWGAKMRLFAIESDCCPFREHLWLTAVVIATVVSATACGDSGPPGDRALALSAQAKEAESKGEVQTARSLSHAAVECARSSDNKFLLPRMLVQYSDTLSQTHDLPDAEKSLNEAVQLYNQAINAGSRFDEENAFRNDRIAALAKRADLLRAEGKFDEALAAYKATFNEAQTSLGSLSVLGQLSRNYTRLLRQRGRTEEAEAVELDFQSQDPDTGKVGTWHSAVDQMNSRNYAAGERLFRVFAVVAHRRQNAVDEESGMKYTAICQIGQGKTQEAKQTARAALALAHTEAVVSKEPKHVSEAAMLVYFTDNSLTAKERSDMHAKMTTPDFVLNVLRVEPAVAYAFIKRKDFANARRVCRSALEVLPSIPPRERKFAINLSDVAEAAGDKETAARARQLENVSK
jgi:tetratricopeptide (TPR) repeat protein